MPTVDIDDDVTINVEVFLPKVIKKQLNLESIKNIKICQYLNLCKMHLLKCISQTRPPTALLLIILTGW